MGKKTKAGAAAGLYYGTLTGRFVLPTHAPIVRDARDDRHFVAQAHQIARQLGDHQAGSGRIRVKVDVDDEDFHEARSDATRPSSRRTRKLPITRASMAVLR